MLRKLSPEFTFAGFTFPRYIADIPPWFDRKLLVDTLLTRLRKRRESRKVCGPYYHAPTPNNRSGIGFYFQSTGPGLRMLETGDSFSHDGHDTFTGLIARLPKGRGFLAGWTMGPHMASALDSEIYDDEDDARRAARNEAESACDDDAEYQAEYQAEGDDE